ncbi:adenylyl-sulfate kinase [Acidovorax sp. GBBC 3334]|uniref:adenylyl-sulfate kinase n=1 Tax=Acidovorax sp. GBBC 3334 TaxID=2940496 RepID=UPI002303BF9B|nr:adenylyl-sulfate kinase [Acidovorax sp. GBBC 3334]MDA8455063.1 adenylyl-sulfate kinase [Acidovorax sp. GBBC 3334]
MNVPPDACAPVTRQDRERLQGHAARAVWLTGLSGAGKTTLAHALEASLHRDGLRACVLDGDRLRAGLSSDLGFSDADRAESTRRAAHVARLFVDAGVIAIVALISPFRAERAAARALFAPGDFIEVYVNVPLAVAERRDPKGLYRRARSGALPRFTGIDSPYEPPAHPALELRTDEWDVAGCVDRLRAHLGLGRHGEGMAPPR